ncbi:MAG: L,D-transpeptidase family protein [Verrucomicrobia bacterium]|nr:L,D-transpeptidase family protein [Verrucomicrobiota bacterium]
MHQTFRKTRWKLVALALLCGTLGSCTNLYYYGPSAALGGTRYLEGYTPGDPRYSNQQVDTESWWRGDGAAGEPAITISLSQQKAYFYKGGRLVGVSSISSGDEQHPTPRGRYSIQQKDQWHQSSQYGDYVDAAGIAIQKNIDRSVDPMPRGAKFDGANMFYFMRITRGIGMHAGYLPGYAASHGCIRMPQHMAEAFYRNVHTGTPVDVR